MQALPYSIVLADWALDWYSHSARLPARSSTCANTFPPPCKCTCVRTLGVRASSTGTEHVRALPNAPAGVLGPAPLGVSECCQLQAVGVASGDTRTHHRHGDDTTAATGPSEPGHLFAPPHWPATASRAHIAHVLRLSPAIVSELEAVCAYASCPLRFTSFLLIKNYHALCLNFLLLVHINFFTL